MATIKYFDGKKATEVEVNEGTAAGYKEIRRAEWRMDKRIERHEAAISLTQMENEDGFQLEDLTAAGPLDAMIEREEQAERRAGIEAAAATLTERQKQVLSFLHTGKTVSEIARRLNLNQKSVWEIRDAIQKKFKKFL